MKLFFGSGKGRPVSEATDLLRYLPNGRRYHYRDGYSMAEAAKSWVAAKDYLPSAIAAVVGTREFDSAHFEYPTHVWGGGTAMTDVMAFLSNAVVAIEGKVDEKFDDRLLTMSSIPDKWFVCPSNLNRHTKKGWRTTDQTVMSVTAQVRRAANFVWCIRMAALPMPNCMNRS
jgi:hypothetical protein